MNYDLAVGIDNSTLNGILGAVYEALYPVLLKDSIQVNSQGIASVDFDINKAPTVLLSQSHKAKAYFEKHIEADTYGPTSKLNLSERAQLLAAAVGATLDLSLPSVVLTTNYTSGKQVVSEAKLSVSATIQTSVQGGQNVLSVQILPNGKITLSDDPVLEALLDLVFIPLLTVYLNTKIFTNISVPALKFGDVQISMPLPEVQSPYLLAYAALGSVQPDVPPLLNWPTGCFFASIDASVFNAVAGTMFPKGTSGGFNWDIVSGSAAASVQTPQIAINGDGSITATITAEADCNLTLHTPNGLPNVSFSPSGSASISATLTPSVNNGEVCVSLDNVDIPSISFDWGIPSWINWLFSPIEDGLADALNALLNPLIGDLLDGLKISVTQLPTVSIALGGKTINVSIPTVTTSSLNSQLVIEGQLSVSSTSSESLT